MDSTGIHFSCKPFIPHPALRNRHAQTIAAALIPRKANLTLQRHEARLFDVEPEVQVLADCSWQPERMSSPTVVIVHGMEGSSQSPYMISTAEKFLSAGFNAVRLNLRNCGGTEHMTPTLYHAGLTNDLQEVTRQLAAEGFRQLFLVGFSLGGNIVLKLAGEYAGNAPTELRGAVALSASIDLTSCIDTIELRSNLFYQLRFLASLKARMRLKAELFPDRYDASLLGGIWSIRKFDDLYTAPQMGFRNASEYYERASSLRYIDKIAIPTLIIHAKDDPFIPYAPLERAEVTTNPYVLVLAPDNGGHVGFVSAHSEAGDHFWAEARAVEFIRTVFSL